MITSHIHNYQKELNSLTREHKILDEKLGFFEQDNQNVFLIQQLKKKKLMIKDRIAFLEAQIYPDIIA